MAERKCGLGFKGRIPGPVYKLAFIRKASEKAVKRLQRVLATGRSWRALSD